MATNVSHSVKTTHMLGSGSGAKRVEAVHNLMKTVRDRVSVLGHVSLHLEDNGKVNVRVGLSGILSNLTVNNEKIKMAEVGDNEYFQVEVNGRIEIKWLDKEGIANTLLIALQRQGVVGASHIGAEYNKDFNRIDRESEALTAL